MRRESGLEMRLMPCRFVLLRVDYAVLFRLSSNGNRRPALFNSSRQCGAGC